MPSSGTLTVNRHVPSSGTLSQQTCAVIRYAHSQQTCPVIRYAHSQQSCAFIRYANSQQTCAVIRYAHSQQFGKPNNLKVQPICYIYFCSLYMLVCKTLHEYFLVIHIIDWFQSNRDIQHSFKLFEWKIVLHNKTFINSISPH